MRGRPVAIKYKVQHFQDGGGEDGGGGFDSTTGGGDWGSAGAYDASWGSAGNFDVSQSLAMDALMGGMPGVSTGPGEWGGWGQWATQDTAGNWVADPQAGNLASFNAPGVISPVVNAPVYPSEVNSPDLTGTFGANYGTAFTAAPGYATAGLSNLSDNYGPSADYGPSYASNISYDEPDTPNISDMGRGTITQNLSDPDIDPDVDFPALEPVQYTPDPERGLQIDRGPVAQPEEQLDPEYAPSPDQSRAVQDIISGGRSGPPQADEPPSEPESRSEPEDKGPMDRPSDQYRGPTQPDDPLYDIPETRDVAERVGREEDEPPPFDYPAPDDRTPTGGPTYGPEPGEGTRGAGPAAPTGPSIGRGTSGGGTGLYPGGGGYPGGSFFAPQLDLTPQGGGFYPGPSGGGGIGSDFVAGGGDFLTGTEPGTQFRGTESFQVPSQAPIPSPAPGNIPSRGGPSLQGFLSGTQGQALQLGPQTRGQGQTPSNAPGLPTLGQLLSGLGNLFAPSAQAAVPPVPGGPARGEVPPVPPMPIPMPRSNPLSFRERARRERSDRGDRGEINQEIGPPQTQAQREAHSARVAEIKSLPNLRDQINAVRGWPAWMAKELSRQADQMMYPGKQPADARGRPTAGQLGIQPKFNTQNIPWERVDAELIGRLNRAYDAMPESARESFKLTDAYRSYLHQSNINSRGVYSARAGNSNHQLGNAVDIAKGPALAWLHAHGREYGLTPITPYNGKDPYHIQLIEGAGRVSNGAEVNARIAETGWTPAQSIQTAQQSLGRSNLARSPGLPPTDRSERLALQGAPGRGVGADIVASPGELGPTVAYPEPATPALPETEYGRGPTYAPEAIPESEYGRGPSYAPEALPESEYGRGPSFGPEGREADYGVNYGPGPDVVAPAPGWAGLSLLGVQRGEFPASPSFAPQGYPVAPVERGTLPDIPEVLQGYPVSSVERGALPDIPPTLQGYPVAPVERGTLPDIAPPGREIATPAPPPAEVSVAPNVAQTLQDIGVPNTVTQAVHDAIEVAQQNNATPAEVAQTVYDTVRDAGGTEVLAETAAQVAVAEIRDAQQVQEARDVQEVPPAYDVGRVLSPLPETYVGKGGGPGVEYDEIVGPPMSLAPPFPTAPEYAGPFAGPDVVGNRGAAPEEYTGPFAGPDVMGDRGIIETAQGQRGVGSDWAASRGIDPGLAPSLQAIQPGPPNFAKNVERASQYVPSQFQGMLRDALNNMTAKEKNDLVNGRLTIEQYITSRYGSMAAGIAKSAIGEQNLANIQQALTQPGPPGRASTQFYDPSIVADVRDLGTPGWVDQPQVANVPPPQIALPEPPAPPSVTPETTPSVPTVTAPPGREVDPSNPQVQQAARDLEMSPNTLALAISLLNIGTDEIREISRRLRIPPEMLVMAALQNVDHPFATFAEGGAVEDHADESDVFGMPDPWGPGVTEREARHKYLWQFPDWNRYKTSPRDVIKPDKGRYPIRIAPQYRDEEEGVYRRGGPIRVRVG